MRGREFPDLERLSARSLLRASPRDREPLRLDPALARDLRLPQFLDAIAPLGSVRLELEDLLVAPATAEDRRERAAAVADFRRHPALSAAVRGVRERVAELRTGRDREGDRELLQLVRRLEDLRLLVECVDELTQALPAARAEHLSSRRLRAVSVDLAHLAASDGLTALRHDLDNLREGLRNRRSVTVGINLDDRLRPREAVLLSVNDDEYRAAGAFDAIGRALFRDGDRYRTRAPMHRNGGQPDAAAAETSRRHGGPTNAAALPLEPLFRDLDHLLREVSGPLARALGRYNAVHVDWLARLVTELAVVDALSQLHETLEAAGLPVTTGSLEEGPAVIHAEGVYDPVLALQRHRDHDEDPVVPGDATLFENHAAVVVTGANNAGKTTFLRAIGIATLCTRAGLPVTARRFRTSCDGTVLTEFAGGESDTPGEGRFAHEAREIAAVIDRSQPGTLVLLNETFSSTAAPDATELAEELLAVLATRGARAIMATHLHDLPRRSTAESLTIHPDRPYVIVPGLPDRRSLARDVARRAGLDFSRYR